MSEERSDLVEPEGVNAGSAEEVTETAATGADGDPRAGGDPDAAPAGADDEMPEDDEMVGTAGTTPTDPSQFAAPPGQDTGSAG